MRSQAYSIVWVVALFFTWAAIGYDYYDRYHPGYTPPSSGEWTKFQKTMEPITFKTFTNQEVEMDGKSFNNCHFRFVTFVMRGKAPTIMGNSEVLESKFKIVKGPESDGATSILGILHDSCKGKESACDVRRILSYVQIVDENKNVVPELP